MNQLIKNKIRTKNGMTMAEMLITVAIIIILAGVGFIALMSYQRSLTLLERDATAKELFIVAQNHLTAARGDDYQGRMTGLENLDEGDFGTKDPNDSKVHYIVVKQGAVLDPGDEKGAFMRSLMLPNGAIDATVSAGGNYIISYQPTIGKVMDVFYAAETPERFKHEFTIGEYSDMMAVRNNKEQRKKYTDGSVIGWYGGEEAEKLGYEIEAPSLTITNGNKLFAEAKESNPRKDSSNGSNGIQVRLLVKGKQSGAQKYIEANRTTNNNGEYTNTFFLDDLTVEDLHFAARFKEGQGAGGETVAFIPGEDLQIQAVAFSNLKLANIAKGNIKETNSLFDSISDEINENPEAQSEYTLAGGKITVNDLSDGVPDTACIKCIRHLENLDKYVSNFGYNPIGTDVLNITAAIQTEDLNWNDFTEGTILYSTGTGADLYDPGNNDIEKYVPVNLLTISYDGKNHKVLNIDSQACGYVGMFAAVTAGSAVKDLELKDFKIVSSRANSTQSSRAGALAGVVANSTVENVLATYDTDKDLSISAGEGEAGGLIGEISGSTVSYCAAAVKVSGQTAGGFAGSAAASDTSPASITGCYAAGETDDGEYYKHSNGKRGDAIYTVNGSSIAGGFVGTAGNAAITNSYSTAAAETGDSGTAGGFAGSANASLGEHQGISGCYCTGLVKGGTKHAFIGSGDVKDGNKYYSIINEKPEKEDGVTIYLSPAPEGVAEKISAFDEDKTSYDDFIGEESRQADSDVYDNFLDTLYNGKYVLRPIKDISDSKYNTYYVRKHYGDWPAPEAYFVND